MNCNTCNKLSKTKIVGKATNDEPYKYKCKKNKFPSIPSTNKTGKSFNDGKYEYYTESQLNYFTSNNKKRFCFARFNITNSNIISSFALLISVISIIFSSYFKSQEVNSLKGKITKDSIYFNKNILLLKDSLELLNLRLNDNNKLLNYKLQGITKNIVHLADSAKNEDCSNK